MYLDSKIIAAVAIVAVVVAACIAAFALLSMNHDDPTDYSGNWIKYDVAGENDEGMRSYTENGSITMTYLFHSREDGKYQTLEAGVFKRNYTEMGEKAIIPVAKTKWVPEFGSMEEIGTETISTAAGDKECTVYKETVKLGDTRTYWVADGWIPYKIEHKVNVAEQMATSRLSATYIYTEKGHTDKKTDATLVVVEGEGIEVSGNEGTYPLGGKAKLTADYDEERGFGGWYDRTNKLLGQEPVLEITMTTDTEVFARNGLGWDRDLEPGTELDLEDIFDTHADEFRLTNDDTGDTTVSEDGKYVFEPGSYTILAYEGGIPEKVFSAYVDGAVSRTFSWTYDGEEYEMTLEFDYSDVVYAKGLYTPQERTPDRPDHVRTRTFVTYSYEDERMAPYMGELVGKLIELYRQNHSEVDEYGYLDFLVRFTQEIRYQADDEYTGHNDYWKFPLETLFDSGGDCEDTSVLFVAIAHQSRDALGFGTRVAIVLMPQHACAGVMIGGSGDYDVNPDGFIYGETTATGYDLGDIPGKVRDYFLDAKYYPSVSTTVEIA